MARAAVTWETLRELANFRSESGCAVSLYVDLDPSTAPTPADAETRFNSLLNAAERATEERDYDHERRQALIRDLHRIRTWWDVDFDRDGTQGVAVFASSLEGLWRTLPLPEPVADEVRLERELHVAPLVPIAAKGEGALVAFVGRERGQVFRLLNGRLEEVVDQTDEQPGQHTQGGWSQARYQRHIEKLVQEHLKSVGDELDRRFRRGGLEIVVVSAPELRNDFEAAVSPEVRDAIVGWATAEAHATPAELLEVVTPHLDRARAESVTESLERWQGEIGRDGRAAAGWEQTLEAASDGRVAVLFVQDAANAKAYRCPECGRGSASPGSCPLDGHPLDEVEDGLDLAIHRTLEYGGAIVPVEGSDLDGHEGIGALLRF
ncbi:MAG: hypothetical protein JO186_10695 [Actinobacteria bacterium]|nr:hypothetical protein [Actinomycetota bacterium]MBV8395662.1 hypothetical protein [Actinomycetota bacterium]MBV8597265.1 hypothetical protein [Actinomycetota bacterium]